MDLISGMRVFVSIADNGSLAKAGRELDLSPSVVSKNISALEDRLGARLLNRTTRSVSLTEVGFAYLDRARRIIGDVDEAEVSYFKCHECTQRAFANYSSWNFFLQTT